MTENILILLGVVIVANIVLIVIAITRSMTRRRREFMPTEASQTYPSMGPTRPASGRSYAPAAASAGTSTTIAAGPDLSPAPNRTDALTGLLLPGEWNRILGDEDARIRRYGRPATIVLIELDGLDRLIGALGPEAGDRVLPALADALSRHARSADHFARLGAGRFGILLPETGEIEAVNYVERIRQVCELWLESGAIAMRLAIGWAAPPVDGSLADAFSVAQDRMFAELRRGSRRTADLAPDAPAGRHDLEGSPAPA